MSNNGMIVGVLIAIVVIVGGLLVVTNDNEDEPEPTENTTSQTNEESTMNEEASSNIVELAQATDSLSTLVAAVVEAELVDTLSGEGPFTVFAPTNDAFAELLAELDVTAEQLLARDDLGAILTYHVVAASAMAGDLSDGQVLETVQGGTLTVSIDGGTVTLTDANGNEANVVQADIEASNGLVHVIDAVVLP